MLGCVRINQLKLALAEPLLLDSRLLPTPPSSQPNTPSGEGGGVAAAGVGGLVSSTTTAAVVAARGSQAFDPLKNPPPSAEEMGESPLGNPQFLETWEDNGESHPFRVRGPGYLSGGGKEDAGKPFGRFVRADLYKVTQTWEEAGWEGGMFSWGGCRWRWLWRLVGSCFWMGFSLVTCRRIFLWWLRFDRFGCLVVGLGGGSSAAPYLCPLTPILTPFPFLPTLPLLSPVVQMEAGVDRIDNIASVGRAAKVLRRLKKAGEFLIVVNLQVARAESFCFFSGGERGEGGGGKGGGGRRKGGKGGGGCWL